MPWSPDRADIHPVDLSHIVVAYESEHAARSRLVRFGYERGVAAEIATYLGQSSDLQDFVEPITATMHRDGLAVEFVELEDLPGRWAHHAERRDRTLIWCVTDGIRFYRGSSVPALARLGGFARFGSPATAQHLCQDKFASLALARSAGVPIPPTRLVEGATELARMGDCGSAGPFFVKPNTLGAKIGIFADSRCETLAEAREVALRIWNRYHDRALIQPFIAGDDVRVSFMDNGGDFAATIGLHQLLKDPASETGGAFMTMKDNASLSGARDTQGRRGAFGAEREAAFVPRLRDLRAATDPRSAVAVAEILESVKKLSRLLRLRDYFSMDFRIDTEGHGVFLEFETCPAVTIYDFQTYIHTVHHRDLGEALALGFRLAFARRQDRDEA